MAEATRPTTAAVQGPTLKREMGPIAILFSSVGVVIGSGWLLGAYHATLIAGPAALVSWIIGALAILILGLNLAELGGMYSVAGGLVRYPHFAFGSLAGFSAGWFYFLGSVTTAPIEALAVLTYASNYLHGLLNPTTGSLIWPAGYVVAVLIMAVLTILNVIGIKWMSEVNKYAVWWKILIPSIAIVAIIIVGHNSSLFSDSSHGGFAPDGFHGILAAVTAGGIVFSYTGFEGAISFGAESKNPARDIPFAVIGAMLIGAVIYILLQVAFLTGLPAHDVVSDWTKINLGASATGPFAAIAAALGMSWLALVLYIDAIISPADTGLLQIGTASRTIFAIARNKYIPSFFGRLNTFGVPWIAIVFSFIVGLICFGPFPNWGTLVGLVTDFALLTYATVPISVSALRKLDPDRPRPFKLPGLAVLAPAGFIIANELLLFAGFGVVWKMFVAVVIGVVLLLVGLVTRPASDRPQLDFLNSWWILPWLIGVVVISYFGSFQAGGGTDAIPFTKLTGGNGTLHFGVDMAVLAAWSLIIYYLAVPVRLSRERAQQYIVDSSSAELIEMAE
ncbi:MAG: APC family permease [Nocardioides sp.]|nr:APC family permease [Nocardioides sp.]